MSEFIDPKVAFTKLSYFKHYPTILAGYLDYEIQGVTEEDDLEQYINHMVMCENHSRLEKNLDNLANIKNFEFDKVKSNNPLHVLHMIVHGVQCTQLKAISDETLSEFMITLYELEKKVVFEYRTNYLCNRGVFPVVDRRNVQIARACFSQLSVDMLWVYLVYLSNITIKPKSATKSDIISNIITGDSEAETNPRWVAMRNANATSLFHEIAEFCRTLGCNLMYQLDPNDITSFSLLSTLMDKCYLLEWTSMSQLETLLSGHDLNDVQHCMGWEKELKMKLPVGTWKTIPEKESLNIFYTRLLNYGPAFMSNLKEFGEFKAKPKTSFVEQALSVHFQSDMDLITEFPTFEFGSLRSVYVRMCIKQLGDPQLSFFYPPRFEVGFVAMDHCRLGFRDQLILFNSYLFDWYAKKEGGTGVYLRQLPAFDYFNKDDTDIQVDLIESIPEMWITTLVYNVAVAAAADGDDDDNDNTLAPWFSIDDILTLYYIIEDDSLYSPHQRCAMMDILKPILTRDRAKKLPLDHFIRLSQTEKNQVIKVFEILKTIGAHMITLQLPDAWPDRSAPCSKSEEDQLMICRRHLAHWILKLGKTLVDMATPLKVFIENLYCHTLSSEAPSFLIDYEKNIHMIVQGMDRFAENIKLRIKDKKSDDLSTGPEKGDGGLKILGDWSETEGDRYRVATELNIWVKEAGAPPSEINSTANYYLSMFGNSPVQDMYTIISPV